MNFQSDWQKAMDQFFQNNVFQSPLQQGFQNPLVCSINADPKALSEQVERLVGMKNWLNMQVQMLEQQIQMLTSQLNTVAAMQQMQSQWQNQFAQFGSQLANTVGSQQGTQRSQVQQRAQTTQNGGFVSPVASGADIAQQWIDSAQQQVGSLIQGLQASSAATTGVNAAGSVASSDQKESDSSVRKTAVKKKSPVAPKKPVQKASSRTAARSTSSSVRANGKSTKAPTFAKIKKSIDSGRVSIQ